MYLGNHYAKECLPDVPQKLKVKDSTYYAHRAQQLVKSEKAFVTMV